MSSFNDNYELLSKNMEELKNYKKNLELNLKSKQEKRIEMEEQYFCLEEKNNQLRFERDKDAKNKNKLINNISETLALALAVFTVYMGIELFTMISNIGMASKILTGIALFGGLGSTYFTVLNIMVLINNYIKNKIIKSNMNKPQSIELTKSINANKKEMSIIDRNMLNISNEITKLENLITEIANIIEEASNLPKTRNEENNVVEEQTSVQTKEIGTENKSKPYTRIRTRER